MRKSCISGSSLRSQGTCGEAITVCLSCSSTLVGIRFRFLCGVRLSGGVLDGSETLHYVRAGHDVDEQLLRQAAAVQALVARAAVLGQRADVSAVLEKVRPGSFSHDELSAITDNFSPLSMERVRVRAVTADTPPVSALEPPA